MERDGKPTEIADAVLYLASPRASFISGEDLSTRPMFRESFRRRRCLIPADGWYEFKGEKNPGNIAIVDDGLGESQKRQN
jgi:putative SOS response-associated peptidase YedK